MHYTCKSGPEYRVLCRDGLIDSSTCARQGPDVTQYRDENGVRLGE